MCYIQCLFFLFFFNDTATTEIYTLSLHDALPISIMVPKKTTYSEMAIQNDVLSFFHRPRMYSLISFVCTSEVTVGRSEEHTSELQSQSNLVCRLLLEKKKKKTKK